MLVHIHATSTSVLKVILFVLILLILSQCYLPLWNALHFSVHLYEQDTHFLKEAELCSFVFKKSSWLSWAMSMHWYKRKSNFPNLLGNSEGSGAKSYMTNGFPIFGEIFAHFLIYCIRKPFLIYDFAPDPIPSEFPYIWRKFRFLFISVAQAVVQRKVYGVRISQPFARFFSEPASKKMDWD